MAIFNSEQFERGVAAEILAPTDHCFYCGNPLTGGVFIYWAGIQSQVWMHPACAKRLADRLNLDWETFKRDYPEKLCIME